MSAAWAEGICARNVLRYASYVYDLHSGLYYLQRRHYDPLTRQFLSRDPLRSNGDESPYQYCAGNPVQATDPSGLYVTASGERDDPQRYVPQSGFVVAKGVGTGHRGAVAGDTSLFARWQGSVGKLKAPGWTSTVGRVAREQGYCALATLAYLLGCPYAPSPFGDNVAADMGFSAALMFLGPFAGAGSALRGVGLVDDAARGTAAALRGAAAGGDIAKADTGGLKLYKFRHWSSERPTGWKSGDRFLWGPKESTPRLDYYANDRRLRIEMRRGEPIGETYVNAAGERIWSNINLLRAERLRLDYAGWRYDPSTRLYYPPH